MPKIKNERLANLVAAISSETIQFDADGIGEIKSEELYEEILNLDGFYAVEAIEPPIDEVEPPVDLPPVDEEPPVADEEEEKSKGKGKAKGKR